jgi:hypothetical protein
MRSAEITAGPFALSSTSFSSAFGHFFVIARTSASVATKSARLFTRSRR